LLFVTVVSYIENTTKNDKYVYWGYKGWIHSIKLQKKSALKVSGRISILDC
jgi:hypothetical protein